MGLIDILWDEYFRLREEVERECMFCKRRETCISSGTNSCKTKAEIKLAEIRYIMDLAGVEGI